MRVGHGDFDGVVDALDVGGDHGYSGDIGDLRHGRHGRGDTHVEVHGRAVVYQAVPSSVLACEVELLAEEAGHVGIPCAEKRGGALDEQGCKTRAWYVGIDFNGRGGIRCTGYMLTMYVRTWFHLYCGDASRHLGYMGYVVHGLLCGTRALHHEAVSNDSNVGRLVDRSSWHGALGSLARVGSEYTCWRGRSFCSEDKSLVELSRPQMCGI